MKIKATAKDGTKVVGVAEVNVELPNSMEALIKKFGADFCTQRLVKALVIDYQSFMRTKMYTKPVVDEKGKVTTAGKIGLKGAELQKSVDEYKPSLRRKGKSFLEKVREKSAGMTPEEKRALIQELTGQAPSKPAARTPVRRAAA